MFFERKKKKMESKKVTVGDIIKEVIIKIFFLSLGSFIVAVGLECFYYQTTLSTVV